MTLDKVIIFGVFIVGYSLSMKHFKDIGLKFREIVKSRLLRILLMIAMFCIAVHFQVKFTDSKVLSISAVMYSLIHGLCLSIFTRLIWYKNPT